jgi:hypothetical protein
MKRKLMLFSALVCLAGGSTLLAQAPARSKAMCEDLIGTECTGGSILCTTASGAPETLFCYDDGIWNWGW